MYICVHFTVAYRYLICFVARMLFYLKSLSTFISNKKIEFITHKKRRTIFTCTIPLTFTSSLVHILMFCFLRLRIQHFHFTLFSVVAAVSVAVVFFFILFYMYFSFISVLVYFKNSIPLIVWQNGWHPNWHIRTYKFCLSFSLTVYQWSNCLH